jgi:hypothetical protein
VDGISLWKEAGYRAEPTAWTAINVVLVGFDVGAPFPRQIIQRENCRYRTDRNTGNAVNALSGNDTQSQHFIERRASIVIGVIFGRMDAIARLTNGVGAAMFQVASLVS